MDVQGVKVWIGIKLYKIGSSCGLIITLTRSVKAGNF